MIAKKARAGAVLGHWRGEKMSDYFKIGRKVIEMSSLDGLTFRGLVGYITEAYTFGPILLSYERSEVKIKRRMYERKVEEERRK